MLTLTRREGESLFLMVEALDNPIEIRLTQVKDHYQARISIDAPQSVRIRRDKVLRDQESVGPA